jgi:tetratricopeptide (TPR) repeat protein
VARLLLTDNASSDARKEEGRRLIRRAIDKYSQVAVDSPDDLDRRLTAANGYVDVARISAPVPDFAQEFEEVNRRLGTELEALLAGFPDSRRCWLEVAYRYRSRAFVMQQHGSSHSQVEQAHREAVRLFENVLRESPNEPGIRFNVANGYANLGDDQLRLGRLADAEASFGRAIEIYAQREAEITAEPLHYVILESINDYARLALFLANTHKWEEASEWVRKAAVNAHRLTDPASSANALYYVAVAQARLGDKAGYHTTCKALVELPMDSVDYVTNSRPIWTACIAPDALDDLNRHVKRAEEYLAKTPPNERHWGLYLLGAAHYRAGQFAQASERLEESIAAYPTRPRPGADTINYQQLLLAMTQWQLDQRDEARRLLADTLLAVEQELQSPASSWNRRATLEILRDEATASIKPKEASEAVVSENKYLTRNADD